MKKKVVFNVARIAVLVVVVIFIVRQIHLSDSYLDKSGVRHFGKIDDRSREGHILFTDAAGKRNVPLSEIEYKKEATPYEPGILGVVAGMNKGLLILAFASWFFVPLLAVWRWKILLEIQGVRQSFRETFKLTYIGMFFTNAMPGITGGDIVKAYYIARRTHKKTEAITTIALDRVIGITGLIFLCSIMLTFKLGDERFRQFGVYVLGAIAVGVLGAVVFFTEGIRNLLGINKLKSRLPFQKVVHEIDSAILIYKKHVPTVCLVLLLSVGVHVGVAMLNFTLGAALGITQMGLTDYFVLIPILLTIMALPIAPAGWGVGELAYIAVLGSIMGVGRSDALALSITQRIVLLIWSLLGGLFLITGGVRISAGRIAHEVEEAREEMVEARE